MDAFKPNSSGYKILKRGAFIFDTKEDPYTKQMYFGLYEIGVRHVMQTFLKKGDTFIDVGASIGCGILVLMM